VAEQQLPSVEVTKSRVSLAILLVPLLALLVGGWLIYKYYSQLGPTITILFKESGGLEPKSSYIKFRDVKVGVVERVEILAEGVRVRARMNRDVAPFLNETTKFWIVKPEIGLGKIRGLDALMSGAYIQMYAKLGHEPKEHFVGLDEPPIDLGEERGRSLSLVAERSYDLAPGDPVYYRQIEVGRIERVQLDPTGKRVIIHIFVKEPYDRFVNTTTRFWNINSISVNLNDRGLDVQMNSLAQILSGGIEFATQQPELESPQSLGEFYLYPSKAEANRKRIGVGQERYLDFVMEFDENVGYLPIGAAVKIEGFRVGEVKDIRSHFDLQHKRISSRIIASIDVAAFRQRAEEDGLANLKRLVAQGLRARLSQSLPILNDLYVELVFTDESNATLFWSGEGYYFPTTKGKLARLTATIQAILDKIEEAPIERTLESLSALLEETKAPLRTTLLTLKRSLANLNHLLETNATQNLPRQLEANLHQLQETLASYQKLAKSYGHDSLFKERLDLLLYDLDRAIKEANRLLRKLRRKPNAIIFGD